MNNRNGVNDISRRNSIKSIQGADKLNSIILCEVEDDSINIDPNLIGIISVKPYGEFKDSESGSSTNTFKCSPLLPFFINVKPKKGELVLVFKADVAKKSEAKNKELNSMIYYIGPVLSSQSELNYESAISSIKSISGIKDALDTEQTSVQNLPNSKKNSIVNPSDVSVNGRQNNDIIFKDNETLIRNGYKKSTNDLSFNNINPSFIQMKYGSSKNLKSYVYRDNVNEVVSDDILEITIIPTRESVKDGQIYYNKTIIVDGEEITKSGKSLYSVKKEIDILINDLTSNVDSFRIIANDDDEDLIPSSEQINVETITEQEKKTVFDINNENSELLENRKGSVINVASDKINLFSHLNNENKKAIKDGDYMYDQIDFNSLQSIPYGEKLVKILKDIMYLLLNHKHAGPGKSIMDGGLIPKSTVNPSESQMKDSIDKVQQNPKVLETIYDLKDYVEDKNENTNQDQQKAEIDLLEKEILNKNVRTL